MIEDAAGETEVVAREGKAVNATTVKHFFHWKEIFWGKNCDHHPETSSSAKFLQKLLRQIISQKVTSNSKYRICNQMSWLYQTALQKPLEASVFEEKK